MLLQADWKGHLQCFVKQVRHEPNESDGFVWPAPTFEFYDRQGLEITGQRRQNIISSDRTFQPTTFNLPDHRGSYMRGKSVFSEQLTEAKLKASMEKVRVIQDELDNHMLDAFKYGMGAMEIEPPKDTIKISNHYGLEIMRPGLRKIYNGA